MAKALVSVQLEKFSPEHVLQMWRGLIEQSQTNTMAALSGGVDTRKSCKDAKGPTAGLLGDSKRKKVKRGKAVSLV